LGASHALPRLPPSFPFARVQKIRAWAGEANLDNLPDPRHSNRCQLVTSPDSCAELACAFRTSCETPLRGALSPHVSEFLRWTPVLVILPLPPLLPLPPRQRWQVSLGKLPAPVARDPYNRPWAGLQDHRS